MKLFLLALLLTTTATQAPRAIAAPRLVNAAEPLKLDFPFPSSIVQFFYTDNPGDDKEIEIYVITSREAKLRNEFVGRIEVQGGPPYIESVFLENGDDDPEKELFILVRWEIRHPGLNTAGNFYKTYIYDRNKRAKNGFSRVTATEQKIGSGLDGQREGKPVSYRFKSVNSIRALMRKLGY